MKSSRIAVVMIMLGFLAFMVAPYGVYHYRDQATKRAESYAMEHLHDYNSGDFTRAMDRSLEETRWQRAGFYTTQFAGFLLACWGASKLRQKPQIA